MRPWAWVRRFLALAVTIVFVLGVLVAPVFAAGKTKSGGGFSSSRSSGTSSGSRSYSSTPKSSTPSTPSRSYSTPKSTPTPSTPSRSYSSTPPPTTSTPNRSYTTPTSPGYSSGDRSYSSQDRSFSSSRPDTTTTPSTPGGGTTTSPNTVRPTPTPAPSYDVGRTRYPTRPPVIIYGPSPYDPWYWHDYYYGQPWYWRVWHRPVYYGPSRGWGISWLAVAGFGIGIWVLLAVLAANSSRRRRQS